MHYPQLVFSTLATLVLLPACEFHCSVGKDINEKVQSSVEKTLLKKFDLAVKVVCPKLKDVDSAKCDASTDSGLSFPLRVNLDEDGEWNYQTEGVAFGSQVEDVFKNLYSDKFGLVLEKISCPEIVKLGNEAVCDGLDQGVKIPFEVMYTTKDGKDDLDFRPKSGILIIGKLEAALLDKGKDKGVTKVECGKPRLMVSVPDKKFECTLSGAEGLLRTQTILITNETGGVKFL